MSKKEILRVMKNWKPYEYLGGGKRKKDLTLEDVLIIKQMPPFRILEAIIRNPIEAISTSVKYPKDVLSFAVYGMKKEIKRLISFGGKC